MIDIPALPDDLMPNIASLYIPVMGQDADAAYNPGYPRSPSWQNVPCSAQPRMVEEMMDDQNRIQRVQNYHVFFAFDPQLPARSKLLVKIDGNWHTLIVQATRNEGGVGVAFVVRAIERL